MPVFDYYWSDETLEHLADNGVSQDDIEWVVSNPESLDKSRKSDRRAAFGHTPDGRYIIAIYEMIDELMVEPVTAFEVPEPRRRR